MDTSMPNKEDDKANHGGDEPVHAAASAPHVLGVTLFALNLARSQTEDDVDPLVGSRFRHVVKRLPQRDALVASCRVLNPLTQSRTAPLSDPFHA
jgi:hypothetical protein